MTKIKYLCSPVSQNRHTMKKTLLCLSLLATLSVMADGPWKFVMRGTEPRTTLKIDLYEESVDVPQMDDFGPMNGYLLGDIYGTWMVTSSEVIDSTHARMRLSNDFGSETQEVLLTLTGDSICRMELKGGVVIKRVEGKKLVKIKPLIEFRR